MNLSGRTILITGAAQGIGLATAQLCAALDANVILLDRSEEQLDAALASFDSGKAMKIAGDLCVYTNDRLTVETLDSVN